MHASSRTPSQRRSIELRPGHQGRAARASRRDREPTSKRTGAEPPAEDVRAIPKTPGRLAPAAEKYPAWLSPFQGFCSSPSRAPKMKQPAAPEHAAVVVGDPLQYAEHRPIKKIKI